MAGISNNSFISQSQYDAIINMISKPVSSERETQLEKAKKLINSRKDIIIVNEIK
ncbi:hypothetical protein [Lacticaseibacillus paracasei]|uniref:hypothetical protein n=1 Tax=Lacticaseibacillus paracasei TaxID=1597 RepID=UPI000FF6F2C0|nr:hypothetical protein [Lacticaseibacillus paracasei]RND57086.1 hypothetical protein FAM18119_01622 [Lacticaseibacillus paracasei]